MFTGGSDDEAVCIRVVNAFVTNAGWYRQEHFERKARKRMWIMNTTARPNTPQQHNPAAPQHSQNGLRAVSLQDYTRISNERTEFLSFLLTPNPHGIPVSEYGVLKAA